MVTEGVEVDVQEAQNDDDRHDHTDRHGNQDVEYKQTGDAALDPPLVLNQRVHLEGTISLRVSLYISNQHVMHLC